MIAKQKAPHTSTHQLKRLLGPVVFTLLIALAIFLAAGLSKTALTETKGSTDDSFMKYGQEFKGKICKSYEESKEWWPEAPKPKPGTPKLLIILLDDVGFAPVNWIKWL